MLKEYRIKDNYVIDELDLASHDFKVRDVSIEQKNGEVLVYNKQRKRIESVIIPTGQFWNGNTLEVDFNFNEEQKKIEAEKKLKADIKRASIAYVAYQNGWIENYDKEGINNWIEYLRNKSKGIKTSLIIPARPTILKDF